MQNTSPFKFLDAYNKEDKDIFFGRDDEVEQLYNLVFQSNLTLVYGQSGTGKTSLVQCGLANRFAQSDWFNVYIRRNEQINNSLLQALKRYDVSDTEGGSLRERLMRKRRKSELIKKAEEEEEVSELIRTLRSIYKHFLKPIYLIFDQFEELFILGNRQEQEAFYDNIAEVLETEAYCRVIFIMREESIAELYDFEKVLLTIFEKRLRVEPMSRAKTGEVILRTMDKFEIPLENKAVSEQIIDVLSEGQGRVELTYLQVFLDQLYQEAVRRSPTRIYFDQELIQRIGGIEDVLQEFLDTQTRNIQRDLETSFPDVSSTAVQRTLSGFVTLEGTKRPKSEDQVKVGGLNGNQVSFIIEKLAQARILRFENDLYELSHDALAKHIAGKRSAEEIALLQVTKIVKDRQQAFGATNTYLNANELQLVKSLRRQLEDNESLGEQDWIFVRRSSNVVGRRRMMLIAIVAAIIVTLAGFSLYSNNLRKIAEQERQNAEKALLQAEASRIQEKKAKYNQYLNEGKARMAGSDFPAAIEAFRIALDFDPLGQEARDSLEVSENKSNVSSIYQELIDEGDALMDLEGLALVDAREKYRKALALGFNDTQAQRKLDAANGRLEGLYAELIIQANVFFKAQNSTGYRYALETYRKAARIKPGDRGVQEQIRKCQQALKD